MMEHDHENSRRKVVSQDREESEGGEEDNVADEEGAADSPERGMCRLPRQVKKENVDNAGSLWTEEWRSVASGLLEAGGAGRTMVTENQEDVCVHT